MLQPDTSFDLFLPEQIQELTGDTAWQFEQVKRRLLDYYHQHHYQLVFPPCIEYLDTFLNHGVADLDLQTFRLTDPGTGKMLAVRSDFTAQVIRIDAQLQLNQRPEQVNRFCYVGELLHTNAAHSFRCRNPVQTGMEIFGNAILAKGIQADLEVVAHLLHSLEILGIRDVCLDIGHTAILKPLIQDAGFPDAVIKKLLSLIQAKNIAGIENLLSAADIVDASGNAATPSICQTILDLVACYGGIEILERVATIIRRSGNLQSIAAMEELQHFAANLQHEYMQRNSMNLTLYFDPTELRGFSYHEGLIFSAVIAGIAKSVATGGRYTGISTKKHQPRLATGFSMNLTQIMQMNTD